MDIFTTAVLNGVVQDLKTPPSFLLDNFFTETQTETSEEIHFDTDNAKRRIAPFVSPLVSGKIVASRGYKTGTFKPAYVKDKRVFDANRPMKRAIGEKIGGTMSPADRMRLIVASELTDQVNMINRRLEVMAGEALRTGKVTVTGEQYPTQVVDYGRDAGLTVTLTGGNRWGQSGVNPLDSLQDWAQLVLQKSGAMPKKVVMTVDVWKIFRKDAEVQKQLDRFRSNASLVTDAQATEDGVYMGDIDGFQIYVYSGWYIDPDDAAMTEVPILAAGTVILGGAQIEGVRAYGAIRDEEAGFQALSYYAKSWLEKDPSVRYLLMQSAPLVVPYRVNASFAATVL